MDSLQVLRGVHTASKKHYKGDSHNHKQYLIECNVMLDKYFEINFSDRYIYSLISFRDEVTGLTSINSEDSGDNKGYNFNKSIPENTIQPFVVSLFEDAKNGETINLTQLLLTKKEPHDFYLLTSALCKTSMSFWDDEFDKMFDLSSLIWDDSFEHFMNINCATIENFRKVDSDGTFEGLDNEKFGKYLYNYKRLNDKYLELYPGKAVYIHLIRPYINEFKYNILLSLVTNEHIKREEFTLVNLFLYRILANTVVEKVKEAEKIKSYETTNMSTHLIKTFINFGIKSKIDNLQDELKNRNVEIDITALRLNSDKLFSLAGIINLLTKLNDKTALIETALEDLLITNNFSTCTLDPVLNDYNKTRMELHQPIIVPIFKSKDRDIWFKCFNHYASQLLCSVLIVTILENVSRHGIHGEEGIKNVEVTINPNGWKFSNISKTEYNSFPDKLTGNLHFFSELINSSNDGQLNFEFPTKANGLIFSISYNQHV